MHDFGGLTTMRQAIALLGIALVPALLVGQQPMPEPITDPAAYEVYAALLAPRDGTKRPTLLIQEAVKHQGCRQMGELNAEWKPVMEDFERQNSSPRALVAERLADRNVEVIPRETLYARFPGLRRGEWADYYAFFSVPLGSYGFAEMSAVGFDATKTRALVHLGGHCGGDCGGGRHHFLEKVGGKWVERWQEVGESVNFCVWFE
jgi:hypothetical protein